MSIEMQLDLSGAPFLSHLVGMPEAKVRAGLGRLVGKCGEIIRDEVAGNIRREFGSSRWLKHPDRDKERGLYPSSVKVEENRPGLEAWIWPDSISANAHEFGADITPRGRFLSWEESPENAGSFARKRELPNGLYRVFVESVHIPARPYVAPAAKSAAPKIAAFVAKSALDIIGATGP